MESIPSVEATDAIALMDTASAERLGDRRIGSLTDVVSQFNVGEYIQINYRETPSKVAALSYDGFFKWSANRGRGVPGYVIVNPVDMSAEYVALENGMRYVPSAWFNDNLYRRIRFKYPFEIDEDGKPWYIASVYQKKIGWFGGLQVKGAIVADPVSGEITKYNTGEIPVFADVVFDGDLICTQYNNSITGENIGPILSGTASWLTLALYEICGLEFREGRLRIRPVLNAPRFAYDLQIGGTTLHVEIDGTASFRARPESTYMLDGKPAEDEFLFPADQSEHFLRVML